MNIILNALGNEKNSLIALKIEAYKFHTITYWVHSLAKKKMKCCEHGPCSLFILHLCLYGLDALAFCQIKGYLGISLGAESIGDFIDGDYIAI